ncbi:hypothetical protein TNCV_3418571 [Trichonephila clavipes]|nr:hypothetical protein TNCV_3418571 [Trichonephila clavipes]
MWSLLMEVETDQVRKERTETMHINHDSESKFEKSNENMKRTENFQMLPKELHLLKYDAISASEEKHTSKKKFNMLFFDHRRTVKLR